MSQIDIYWNFEECEGSANQSNEGRAIRLTHSVETGEREREDFQKKRFQTPGEQLRPFLNLPELTISIGSWDHPLFLCSRLPPAPHLFHKHTMNVKLTTKKIGINLFSLQIVKDQRIPLAGRDGGG